MNDIKIILNPYANRWHALKNKPQVEEAFRERNIPYSIDVSEHPGHGIDLAKNAALDGFPVIIAAGGDSTFNEIANGLMIASEIKDHSASFGIIPLGTANDLADNLGIPKEIHDAVDIIQRNQPTPLDVCKVNERFFLNNSAIGLETTVTEIQMNMTRVHGVFRYLLATFAAIAKNPQWEMELKWDNGNYQGPVTLVSVGNNPRTGGIFYTVPNASPYDGLLSFVYGTVPTRLEILQTLPKIMKSGEDNYTNHPAVHEIHTKNLKIKTTPHTPLHTDGEIIDFKASSMDYSIRPGALNMLQ